jgi:C4-dicarboxylate-binding protein DctP
MKKHWKRCVVVTLLAGMMIYFGAASAVEAETYEFKISIDTTPNHPRTMGLMLFVEELKKASGGRLVATLYHSAQLYKDAHVTKALRMGTVDMAVPGNWVLEGFDTNTSLTMLPMFFGQPGEVTEALIDGSVGQKVNASLEKKVQVKALGYWYELGYDNLWTVKKKIRKIEDLAGLKIRHSGGSLPDARLKALGANPVFIAWPDVPMAMVQGTVDGLCTTAKSAESAKLDEAGLKYGVFARHFKGFYVPMVSLKFWKQLPDDLKKIMLDVWKANATKQRELARKEQKKGEEYLMGKGVDIWYADDATLAKWRKRIMPIQEKMVKRLGHDPELVKAAMRALGM